MKIVYNETLPPTKEQARRITTIIESLAGISIEEALDTLTICERLLLRTRIPEELRVDFPNVIGD